MQLKLYHEVVGDLTDVVTNDGFTKAIFSMIKEVDFPQGNLDYKELKKFVGKKIGIINSDGKYLIRIIKKGGD